MKSRDQVIWVSELGAQGRSQAAREDIDGVELKKVSEREIKGKLM